MAITSIDALIAGFKDRAFVYKYPVNGAVAATGEAAGLHVDTFYLSGVPGAGVIGSPGMSGAALTAPVSGQIPYVNAAGGVQKYLARFMARSSASCSVLLIDRLWHNSGIVVTTTGAQTIDSAAFPSRDLDGSSNGRGVMVGLVVLPTTDTTNASGITTMTFSYTNSAGTSGRTGRFRSFPATARWGTIVLGELDAGDVGVRSIQTVTLATSLGAGAVSLVAFRPIHTAIAAYGSVPCELDPITLGLPPLQDGTVLTALYWLGTATLGTMFLELGFAEG